MRAHPAPARLILVALAVLTLSACSTEMPTTPSAPTLPPTPITALTVTGVPVSLSVGQSVQLTATVTLPSGAQKLTSDATWKSSDTMVATVSTTGLLTAVGGGSADIAANADGQSASARLRVLFRITGLVHETAPTEDVPVTGARIEVQGNPSVTAMTDESGRFVIDVQAAGFSLTTSKDGYDRAEARIDVLPRDQHPDIAVLPSFAMKRFVFDGTLYPECSATEGSGEAGRDFEFAVHHNGIVTLEESINQSFEYSTTLLQGDRRIFGIGQCLQGLPEPCPISRSVKGGYRYRFHIHATYCHSWTRFLLVFTHPN